MTKMNKLPPMAFFIPEWEDMVYDRYDFELDEPQEDASKVYSHEIYDKPAYDGILASITKLLESKNKFATMLDMGLQRYFRFDGPIFGDCGAWGYAKQDVPPYRTAEILDYYDRLGVDMGVSIDHMIRDLKDRERRLAITRKNAAEFIDLHQKKGYEFTPIGALQGWDLESYRTSLELAIELNYEFVAIGSIATRKSQEVIDLLRGFQPVLDDYKQRNGKALNVHLFGVARLEHTRTFRDLGVTSFDSATMLRAAWLSPGRNYVSPKYWGYTALRLPNIRQRVMGRYKKIIAEGRASKEELVEWEIDLRNMITEFDAGRRSAEEVAESFQMFEGNYCPESPNVYDKYLRTLRDRPWEDCPCRICIETGIEVIIFRGNNRNRRRGFHNVYTFHKLMKRILKDDSFELEEEPPRETTKRFSNRKKKVEKKVHEPVYPSINVLPSSVQRKTMKRVKRKYIRK